MTDNEVRNICRLIDKNAGDFVRILLTRIEALKGKYLTIEQFHNIFRALSKELIYENSRILKKTIKFADDTIKFIKPKLE